MVWSNQAPTSIVFPPGATTGERIEIDESGIRAYDSNGNLYFNLDATNQSQSLMLLPPGNTTGQRVEFDENGITAWQRFTGAPGAAHPTLYIGPNTLNTLDDTMSPIIIQGEQGANFSGKGTIYFGASGAAYIQGDTGSELVEVVGKLVALQGSGDGTTDSGSVEISADINTGVVAIVGSSVQVNNNGLASPFSIGSGIGGAYYAENITNNGISLAANTFQSLTSTGATFKTVSDYGSAWSGSNWTCPADGFYDFTFAISNLCQAGNVGYAMRIEVNGTSLFGDDWNAAPIIQPRLVTVNSYFLNKNDVLNFQAEQKSAAAYNINYRISVARRV